MPPLLDFPPAFLDYLTPNWELLSATAYANYLAKGRGVLWVDWLNQLPITSRLTDVGVLYLLPHSKITREMFPSGMSSELRRLIREYDPEITVVVYWSDGEVNRARTVALAGAASPSQAYSQMKDRLPEFLISLGELQGGAE